jgi:hypothetical protein
MKVVGEENVDKERSAPYSLEFLTSLSQNAAKWNMGTPQTLSHMAGSFSK